MIGILLKHFPQNSEKRNINQYLKQSKSRNIFIEKLKVVPFIFFFLHSPTIFIIKAFLFNYSTCVLNKILQKI